MSRLFGTDGIRGAANVDLRPSLAFALGRATAHQLVGPGGALVVGQDTRRSGDMFVAAITAGATSMGVDVHQVGVVPTPALAFLAGTGDFAAGIMVSASHNPAQDNGLKVLDPSGLKLDDDLEDELEAVILRADELPGVAPGAIGRAVDAHGLLDRYLAHRVALAAAVRGNGLHVVLDAANGAAHRVGPDLLRATGARVTVIHDAPDGDNINRECGATHPASLAEAVGALGADVGFALDGDADRCVAVDAGGHLVDGDQVLGILALERLARGALDNGSLVVSVLSNGGLQHAVETAGGRIVRTPVGDKHILAAMLVSGAGLGGEKSGHVIVREHATSGDGIVTALELLRVMTVSGSGLGALAAAVPLLPQQQRAIRVRHRDQWENDDVLRQAIADAEARLAPDGRILVRPSGTEPVLRVMVEGRDAAEVVAIADAIATLAGERLH
ncbi:MAG: phosphoglucosamine mutase [Chloroflexi bacterium RBG_16_72_14]|nr:MAG: phosphoglucosamine mutase [Chloroflexi bacterium RBG_16_72_14]